jgi:Na+/H+ antiporter NhaD/arsenite permease-like protein
VDLQEKLLRNENIIHITHKFFEFSTDNLITNKQVQVDVLAAWVSIISIISFITSIFIWVYDSDKERFPEKAKVSVIGITAVATIVSLVVIAQPSSFTHAEAQILIILLFVVVFAFLSLAEEEKLRVILLGAAISTVLSILFIYQLLPLDYLNGLGDTQLEHLTTEELEDVLGRKLPLSLEQLIEIAKAPSLFFEVALFSSYINWEVITIVFGMSLLVAVLSDTGLFDMVSIRTIKTSQGTPKRFLVIVFFLTLVLSAFLDITTAIILLSGITVTVTRGLDLNPRPYILAEVAATVMAGIITVIGSLPGILIASVNAGNIPFATFSIVNSGFVGIAIAISLFYLFTTFKDELAVSEDSTSGIDSSALSFLDEWSVVDSRRNLYLGSIVLGIVVLGLVLSSTINLSVGFVAVTGAIVAIIVVRSDIQRVIHKVELESILFFIGLFVLVGSLQLSGVLDVLAEIMLELSGGDPFILAIIIITVISFLSAVVANIPITIALAEVILILLDDPVFASQTIFGFPVSGFLWFTLLYAVTFGGGLTPFGTVTGVIGVQVLSQQGYPVTFMEFVKKMAPLSLILLVVGFIYLLVLQATGILPFLLPPP